VGFCESWIARAAANPAQAEARLPDGQACATCSVISGIILEALFADLFS
jgi:hypothetical protein